MDFKLFERGYFYDFNIDDFGKIESSPDIFTAVTISIFTDRRSQDGDEVLDGNKRGWWGDTFHESKLGSRLWVLKRRKATPIVLRLANDIIMESLKWLVDDGVVKKVNVFNEWSRFNIGKMDMLIEVIKPNDEKIEFKFKEKWGVDA